MEKVLIYQDFHLLKKPKMKIKIFQTIWKAYIKYDKYSKSNLF